MGTAPRIRPETSNFANFARQAGVSNTGTDSARGACQFRLLPSARLAPTTNDAPERHHRSGANPTCGAKGQQGYELPADASKTRTDWNVASTAMPLDSDGKVGHLYDAKTTPHMFVIDQTKEHAQHGLLVYNGAIDDNDSSDASDLPKSKNYVAQAIDELSSGQKTVTTATTKPYGCSVKYQ